MLSLLTLCDRQEKLASISSSRCVKENFSMKVSIFSHQDYVLIPEIGKKEPSMNAI